MAENYLLQGIAAAQAGNKQAARQLLASAIYAAPNDQSTWAWFYVVANNDQERIDCLRQILRINPKNENAWELLKKTTAPRQPVDPAIPVDPPTPIEPSISFESTQEDFQNDELARRLLRFMWIFPLGVLLIGLVLIVSRHASTAYIVFGAALVILLAAFSGLYLRYRSIPLVQEKRKVDAQVKSLQAQILAHTSGVHLTLQERERLEHAEAAELSAELQELQSKYIETGMLGARIAEADIPEIGPALKQRLADYGFTNAANIGANLTYMEGFGETEINALLAWRKGIYNHFHASKPDRLPDAIQAEIKNKYEIHHTSNASERLKAEQEKKDLEARLEELQPRQNQLAPLTFLAFLKQGLVRNS